MNQATQHVRLSSRIMRYLKDHLLALNELLPALHDGLFVESYDHNTERLVIVGTSDLCYHRELVITCTSPVEVHFAPSFTPDTIRIVQHESQRTIYEFMEDGQVKLFVCGGVLEFECALV